MRCSELPGKLFPCIIRASEGVAFLRCGKPGLVLLVVAKGILLHLARSSWITQDFGEEGFVLGIRTMASFLRGT